MANLSAPSGPPSTANIPTMSKTTGAQTTIQNVGKALPHTSATFILSTLRVVLRGGLGWHQTERERKAKQDHKKTTEENSRRRKKKEGRRKYPIT